MRAAIYSRKSRLSEKGESVENQINLCEEYGRSIGITDFVIYDKDEGFSGGNTNRPDFQRMLKDAKAKKFTHLICYRLDRISRNVLDFTQTIEELKKYNVEFISIREQFDTTSPMGRAMMNIAAVFAQLERETIAERIKDNMLELSKTGRWLGGTPPLGFKSESVDYGDSNGKIKKRFKLVEVHDEMELVKLIFNLYLEKKGFNSVASHLCRHHFKGKNGGEFSRTTVQQIITNPVYCIADTTAFEYFGKLGATIYGQSSQNGFMVYNKSLGGKKDKALNEWIFSVGEHKGIIPSSVWIECQNINELNKSKASPRSGTGTKFLLSSMVVCGCCGSGMASWSHNNKKSGKYEKYYRCNLRNRAANRCTNKMLNAYLAEEQIVANLKAVDIQLIIKNYEQTQKNTIESNNSMKEIENMQNNIEKNNKTIQGLIRKIALLDDDPEIIKMFKDEIDKIKVENLEFESNIKKIGLEVETFNNNKLSIDEIINRITNFKKFIDFVDDIEKKRELILSVVESVVWHGDKEELEVNLIGSGTELPEGAVQSRNLCIRNKSRWNPYINTSITNPQYLKLERAH